MMFPSCVSDAMNSPVISVDGERNVRESAKLMADSGIGSIIVVIEAKPVGIVTKRDIIKRVVAVDKDPSTTKIKEIMTFPLITTSREMDILSAIRLMREHHISQMLVLDGEQMIGVISERDLIKAVSYAALASFSPLMKGKKK